MIPWLYIGSFVCFLILAVLFLCIVCLPVNIRKPQHEDSPFYRALMYAYIELIMQLVGLKVEVRGLENTPRSSRFLLVCNHQSEADPGVLHHYFRTSQLAFISKKENSTMPFVGKFMHKTLCQMVNRENDREALQTIIKSIQLVKEDKVSMGVFPEGGILVKDKLSHFRSGVFKIAQKAKVPIVVCTLKGTSDVLPNLKRLRGTKVRLHLVGVIPTWEMEGKTTVEIADRVYGMMLEDLGAEYNIDTDALPPAETEVTT
jgi:1-acyl-sn-glycerol-3-phosphate acyltransferase